MNKIAQYDGRRIRFDGDIYEAAECIADGYPATLRSFGGVAHEISADDFRNMLQSIVEALPHHDTVKSQQKRSVCMPRWHKTDFSLGRVEIDCRKADLHCVGTDGAIADIPVICTAIDAMTRVILFSAVVHADRRKPSSSIGV